jgi:hypothetical protein
MVGYDVPVVTVRAVGACESISDHSSRRANLNSVKGCLIASQRRLDSTKCKIRPTPQGGYLPRRTTLEEARRFWARAHSGRY